VIACVQAPYRSTLVLRNDSGALARMTEWILGVCQAAALGTKSAFALQLCLEEAVANIIEHGEGAARASEIVVAVVREGDRVILTVEDNGAPFDPTKMAAPLLPRTIEEATAGGLGIHLMRRFASDVEYRREGGRNQLWLTFPSD
jgi:anti-sigma regulatory factor (Ser/Thr protein kinase)